MIELEHTRILDAEWGPLYNNLKLQCPRGHEWEHRCDRWIAKCPKCNWQEHLSTIRNMPFGR
jgi:hypothetical protein